MPASSFLPIGIWNYPSVLGSGNQSSIITGLGGYWKLNDTPGVGNIYLDSLGVTNLCQVGIRYQSVAGKVGQAIRNNSTYGSVLTGTSTANLLVGDMDFELFGWAYMDVSGTADMGLVDRYSGSPSAFQLYWEQASGLLTFKVGANDSTTTHVHASTYGALPLSTWVWFDAYHDSVNNLIGISINRGAWDTVAWTKGVSDEGVSKGIFMIGAKYAFTITSSFRGVMDEFGFERRLLTEAERNTLYNGGVGNTYPFDGRSLPSRIGILIYGDSKSIPQTSWSATMFAAEPTWIESPTRIAVSGRDIEHGYVAIDTELAFCLGTPVSILYNLGVNDMIGTMPSEADFKTWVAYVWDAMHTKWPSAIIYVVYPWCAGQTVDANTMAGWFDDLRATRTDWVKVGHDERVWLEGGDNGATMTIDGTHYSAAGNAECAAQWLAILP